MLLSHGGGALFAEGIGAGAGSVNACSSFLLKLRKSGNTYPDLPFYAQISLVPPVPDSTGTYTVTGNLNSQVPWLVPSGFGPYDIVDFTQGGPFAGGVCAPVAPGHSPFSIAPIAFGGIGGATTATFTQTSGHRIIRFVYVKTGKLPADWTAQAAVQATLDAAFPGQYKVASVLYPATTIPGSGATDTVEIVTDYTGPTKVLPQGAVVSDSDMSVTTYLKDAGPSPSPGGSGIKTALIVGGTAAALGLAAIGAHRAGWF